MGNPCPQCGSENPVGARACGNCGAPFLRVCPACGFESPANFKFCGNCGASFQTGVAAPHKGGDEARLESPRDSDYARLQRLYGAMPAALAEKVARAGKQMEGERRSVTVLFADLSGYTGISEKLDPEQVYEFIDSTLKAFIEEIYKYEGTLDKFTGDGVMALFGAPVAHEDDPARAVLAALGMQSALLRINNDLQTQLGISLHVRIGLHTGTVVVGSIGSDLHMEYTALGDTVNVAARLETAAEPGTILVSRPVYDVTQPLFEFRALGSIQVKGRAEPIEIFQPLALRATSGRVRGIPGLVAPMVGREEEIARLRRVVEELIETRRGRIVLVTGEAGIGKSRLTAEFKEYLARQPVQICEGACVAYGQSAYGVFLRLMRALFEMDDHDNGNVLRAKIERKIETLLSERSAQVTPYIENLFSVRIIEKELLERVRYLEPAQLQQQTFVAIRDLFVAQAYPRPLVLIFEDVHWIDKLSLDLLMFLLDSVTRAPILLYCVSRPGDGPAAPQIQKAGEERLGASLVHLPLSPLSHADSIALVDLLLSISDLPEHLKQTIPQRAEGNPFYLEEIIRMLIDQGVIRRVGNRWEMAPDADVTNLDVPRTLQGLLMTRVDHLGEGPRHVLQCASVIGRDFSRRLLNGVVDNPATLPDDVRELEARELIHRVGETNDGEYRFHHVLIQETVYTSLLIRRRQQLHQKIAERIEAAFHGRLEEHTEALAFHYSQAQNATRALPYQIRAGNRAAARFANDEALRYYRVALENLTRTRPTLEQRIEVHRGLGQVQNLVGDYDSAINSYLLALELARSSGEPEWLQASPELMRRIGRVHEQRGDYGEALRWMENALSDLERDPSAASAVERAQIYNNIGWISYRRGQLEEAYQWRMRSLQILEGTDHYSEMASAYNGLAVVFSQKGDWERCLAYVEKGLRLREMIGDTLGVAASLTNLGNIALRQCNWDQAVERFERSLRIRQEIGYTNGIGELYNNLGVPYREKGDYAHAIEYFNQALEIAQTIKNRNTVCFALNNRAHAEILQGHFEDAQRDLATSVEIATQMGHKENLAEAHWLRAEAYLGANQLDRAEECARQAQQLASESGNRALDGAVARTFGKIARARSNWELASEQLQRSIWIFGELKNPCERAKSQYALAQVQRDCRQFDAAHATLESAVITFGQLGADVEHRRARAELDELPAPAESPAL